MNTPYANNIPGQTPITDPLALQFMTQGQMGYMPQAQFMTPSEFGTFRTLPTPDVNGYVPQDQGFVQSFIESRRGGPFGLPAYTFNTYNPAISPSLQMTYAQRRIQDSVATLPMALGQLGFGMAAPFMFGAIPGLAAGMLMPDLTKPVTDRIRETRNIQNMSTARIFSGPDRDHALGMGFNYRAARGLDKDIRLAAADDTILKEGDYRELLKLGIEYGQFDYANNVEQYKRILKNLRGSLTTMMEVVGSTDFKDLLRDMKRMQDMGASIRDYGTIARREQTYARMTGLTQQQAVDTYGRSGALIFQQSGLNAMQGSLQAMANAANMTYLQRTGVLNPVTLAQHGGISGLTQRMTQQDARVQRSYMDMILPGLLNDSMTGLREGVDLAALLSKPGAFQNMVAASGRIHTPQQMMAYGANKHHLYTELVQKYGPELEVALARGAGEMIGLKGQQAAMAGLILGGMDMETAMLKVQGVYSEGAQSARERTMEEARQKRREEAEQRNNPLRRLERMFRGAATSVGEAVYSVTRTFSKHSDEKAEDMAGRMAQVHLPQSDFSRRRSKRTPLLDRAEAAKLWSKGDLTDEEGLDLLNELAPVTASETGKTGLAAMGVATKAGYGALQMIPEHFDAFFGGKGAAFKGIFDRHLQAGDKELLISLRKKADSNKLGEVTDAEMAAFQRMQGAWGEASGQSGFTGAYTTFLRDMAMSTFNSAVRDDARVGLFKQNSGLMASFFGMANQFSPKSFSRIMSMGLGNMTAEEIQAEIDKDGGQSLVTRVFDAADTVFQELKPELKGNRRYRVGGAEYRKVQQNLRNIQAEKNLPSRQLTRIAYGIKRDADFNLYKQENRQRTNGEGGYVRPDCSGLMHETIKRYIESNGGVAFEDEELTRKYTSNLQKDLDTAANIYDDMVRAGGGEMSYDTWAAGKSQAELEANTRALKSSLKEGMIIAIDYNTERNKDRKRSIDHIGMVVRDVNGELKVMHQSSSRNGTVLDSVDSFISGMRSVTKDSRGVGRGATFYTTDLNAAMKKLPMSRRRGLSELEERELYKYAVDSGAEQSAKLLDERLDSAGGKSITYGDQQRLVSWRRMAGDASQRPEDYINMGLQEILEAEGLVEKGSQTTMLDKADIEAIYSANAGDMTDVKGMLGLGAQYDAKGSRGQTAIIAAMLRKKHPQLANEKAKGGIGDKADEIAYKLMSRYTKSGRKDQSSGVGAIMQGIGVVGFRRALADEDKNAALLAEVAELERKGGVALNKYIRTEWKEKFGLQAKKGEGGAEIDDFVEEWAQLIGDRTAISGSEYGVGQLFESVMYGAELANEYSAAMVMSNSKKQRERDAADPLLKQQREQFYIWGESIGLTQAQVDEVLKEHGGSGGQAILQAMYAKRGVALNDKQQSVISKAIKFRGVGRNIGDADEIDYLTGQVQKRKADKDFGAERIGFIRNAANAAAGTNVFIGAGNFSLDAHSLRNIHDKNVVSDATFEALMQNMSQMGLKDQISMMRDARANNRKLTDEELLGLSFTQPIGGAENPMSNAATFDETAASHAKINSLIWGAGSQGGSNFLSPQTDAALGELPGTLGKLNDTLTNLNGTLANLNRNGSPKAPGVQQ